MVALFGLYVCLFLLQNFTVLADVANLGAERWEVQLGGEVPNSIDRTVSATVTGDDVPGSDVVVEVGQRKFSGKADSLGKARVPIRLAETDRLITVETREPEMERHRVHFASADHTARLRCWGKLPLVVDLALLDVRSNKVWLAGRGLGWTLPYEGWSGDIDGVFESWVPLGDSDTLSVVARSAEYGSHATQDLEIGTEQLTRVTELPLSRSLTIRFENGIPLSAIEIRLPDKHPAFDAIARGNMTPEDFIRAVWGADLFLEMRIWQQDDIKWSISREGEEGIVKLNASSDGPIDNIQIGGRESIAATLPTSTLMWSERDSVTIQFAEVQPQWFDPPLPTRLDDHMAQWRGPLATPRGLRVGVRLPTGVVPATRAARPKAEEVNTNEPAPTMRDWVTRNSRQSWMPPMEVVPLLAFLWLAWRRPFGNPRLWPPAAATVTIIAAFALWFWAYRLLGLATDPWLSAATRFGWGWYRRDIWQFEPNAFFLAATAALVTLTPAYSIALERSLVGRKVRREPRSRRRMIWRGLTVLWGVPWIAILACLIALRTNHDLRSSLESWLNVDAGILARSSLHDGAKWNTQSGLFEGLGQLLQNDSALCLLIAAVAPPALLALGLRAFAFGLTWFFLVARFCYQCPGELENLRLGALGNFVTPVVAFFHPVGRLPWAVAIAAGGLVTIPFVVSLLRSASPMGIERRGAPGLKVACLLVPTTILLGYIPPRLAAAVAGCGVLGTLGWVLLRGSRRLEPVRSLAARWAGLHRRYVLLVIAAALVLVWPTPVGNGSATFRDIIALFGSLRELFATLVVGLFLLLLKRYSETTKFGSSAMERPVVLAGALMFAVFVNQNLGTWLSVIPIPVLAAWLVARYWLLRPALIASAMADASPANASERRAQIAAALTSNKARVGLKAAERFLDKKLSSGEMMPDEYAKRILAYRTYYEPLIASGPSGSPAMLLPFSTSEFAPWETAWRFVRIGALLAAIPLVITLYQYLPSRVVVSPYPAAELVSVILRSVMGWLLTAFFFGFYYPQIRGANGLQKGLAVCASLLIPSFALPLLKATPLLLLQSTLVWGAQVFAFCTLLGGVDDYRTLRDHGFRLRDLFTLHELPWLSVYASSIVAALASGILSLLSGKLGEVAKLFVQGFGTGTPAGP